MKRLNSNRDLFEAPAGEVITVTVQAVKIPYAATFSALQSGGAWTQVQVPTPTNPVEIRTFRMPASSGELFVIDYGFPPAASTPADAEYDRTLSGGGTTDGPKTIFPPPSGSIASLSYEFRLPGGTPESMPPPAAMKKAPAKKAVSKKAPAKKAPAKKDAVEKSATKKTPARKAPMKKSAPKSTAKKGAKRGGRK